MWRWKKLNSVENLDNQVAKKQLAQSQKNTQIFAAGEASIPKMTQTTVLGFGENGVNKMLQGN